MPHLPQQPLGRGILANDSHASPVMIIFAQPRSRAAEHCALARSSALLCPVWMIARGYYVLRPHGAKGMRGRGEASTDRFPFRDSPPGLSTLLSGTLSPERPSYDGVAHLPHPWPAWCGWERWESPGGREGRHLLSRWPPQPWARGVVAPGFDNKTCPLTPPHLPLLSHSLTEHRPSHPELGLYTVY